MPNVTVTIRDVKNRSTGLDLSIPSHTERPGRFQNTLVCDVVAVSNLPCFKTPQHKPNDVIQFTVAREFEQFEEFRRQLLTSFPGIILPDLPKSLLSFVGASIKQQVSTLEKFVKHVAATENLATAVDTIKFLGFSALSAKKLTQPISRDGIFAKMQNVSTPDLFPGGGGDEGEAEEEIFRPPLVGNNNQHSTGSKLFDDQDYGDSVSRDDELVLVAGATDNNIYLDTATFEPDPDEMDLLNVDEDMESLKLQVEAKKSQNKPLPPAKPSTKPDSNIPTKPTTAAKTKLPTKPTIEDKSEDLFGEINKSNVDAGKLSVDDITRYIAENTQNDEDDDDWLS